MGVQAGQSLQRWCNGELGRSRIEPQARRGFGGREKVTLWHKRGSPSRHGRRATGSFLPL